MISALFSKLVSAECKTGSLPSLPPTLMEVVGAPTLAAGALAQRSFLFLDFFGAGCFA
jgi:hypothetical protein